MQISFTSLSMVAHDAPPRAPHLEENIEANVQAFFVAHIEALQAMSSGPDAAPPGYVSDAECQGLFQKLQMGDSAEFVAAADVFAKRLIDRMNRSTAKGLLACVRAEDGPDRLTAVLKLQIDASNGTRLEELASGEIRLAAVTNVLEQPGDFQKGILVDNTMPVDEVRCGDIQAKEAQYFPDAFGIKAFAKPNLGPSALLRIVGRQDADLADALAAVLPRVGSGPVPDVLSEIGEHVPALNADTQTELIETLEGLPRPVVRIDTAKQAIKVIEGDGLTIRGPAGELGERVVLHETEDGWEVRVRFDRKPRTTYR